MKTRLLKKLRKKANKDIFLVFDKGERYEIRCWNYLYPLPLKPFPVYGLDNARKSLAYFRSDYIKYLLNLRVNFERKRLPY